jgi:hypothetical protein
MSPTPAAGYNEALAEAGSDFLIDEGTMQIPVLVEPVAGNGYRAVGAGLAPLSTEGATAEEALQRLRELLDSRLAAGARLVALEVPSANPWEQMAGMYRDDPLFDEWQRAMREYRQQVEEDPGSP